MDPVKGWNGVIDCEVLAVAPCRELVYTWGALGLGSVVTFTLTPTAVGTHVRVEQSGFGEHQDQAYNGARWGWQNFMGKLESVVAGIA
jgi:uncharacterized protein YndB with AHSA1/START domain